MNTQLLPELAHEYRRVIQVNDPDADAKLTHIIQLMTDLLDDDSDYQFEYSNI